jgi:hypothetical protein
LSEEIRVSGTMATRRPPAAPDGDALHPHHLMVHGAAAFQRLHPRRERPRRLLESAPGAVPPQNVPGVRKWSRPHLMTPIHSSHDASTELCRLYGPIPDGAGA